MYNAQRVLHFSAIHFALVLQDGTTAISYAAQYGHTEIVHTLIQANADLNLPDEVCTCCPHFCGAFKC